MGSKKPCPGCGQVKGGRSASKVCRECEVLLERAGWMEEQLAELDEDEIVVSFGKGAHWNQYIYTRSDTGRDLVDIFQRIANAGSRPALTYKAKFNLLGVIDAFGEKCVVMTEPLAEAIRDLRIAVQDALKLEYEQGKKDGQNLLRQLADGDISINDFNKEL